MREHQFHSESTAYAAMPPEFLEPAGHEEHHADLRHHIYIYIYIYNQLISRIQNHVHCVWFISFFNDFYKKLHKDIGCSYEIKRDWHLTGQDGFNNILLCFSSEES